MRPSQAPSKVWSVRGRGVCDGDDADEARAAFCVAGRVKLAEQLRHALGVGRFAPRVARRVDAGRAAERVYHEAGVVRERQQPLCAE